MTPNARVTQKELSCDRILEVASRAIRRDGYAGVGVANVMSEAGLTHGGFYAHFESREAMLTRALQRAAGDSAKALAIYMAAKVAKGATRLQALVETYLADKNLASLESGCPVAALGSEMPRQVAALREESCRRVQSLVRLVASVLPEGAAPSAAAQIASTMVGALQLSRTLGNNAEGKAFLGATRKALIEQYDVVPAVKAKL